MAETLYISGSLHVGLRPDVDQRTPPTSVLTTGMQLEVLGRSAGLVKVRTEDGEEGWIRESYTDKEAPAVLKFAELTKQNQQLVKEHTELLSQQEKLKLDFKQASEKVDELQQQNANLHRDLVGAMGPAGESSLAWLGWLLLMLVLTAAGFGGGVVWHRQQTMKKLGGLRF